MKYYVGDLSKVLKPNNYRELKSILKNECLNEAKKFILSGDVEVHLIKLEGVNDVVGVVCINDITSINLSEKLKSGYVLELSEPINVNEIFNKFIK